jgi:GNAT superfamily N-acetyltransferase
MPEQPELTFTCPTVGELVDLYASLSEAAEPETFEKILKSPQTICISARSKDSDKVLVGFLRAWLDPGTKTGVVYDIVVSPKRRGEDIAKALLDQLLNANKEAKWKGDSRRVVPNLDRHLTVIRTLYAVALTFGFQKVVESAYVQFLQLFSVPGDHPLPELSFGIKVLLALLFAALGFLGIRLFWAVGNIRRFVLRQIIFLNPPKTLYLLVFHFPILTLHAVLYFFLCRFYQDICLNGLYESYVEGLMWVFIVLLTLNVAWLVFLLRVGPNGKRGRFIPPERLWAINNSTFAVAGLIFVTLLCCFHPPIEWSLFIATALILSNSGVNFSVTRRNYILGDAFGGA